MPRTRLGLIGVGVAAYRALVRQLTRLGLIGSGVAKYGVFQPKQPAVDVGPEIYTRLTGFGVGGARYEEFQAKAPAVVVVEEPRTPSNYRVRRPQRREGVAEGELLIIDVELYPGRAIGGAEVSGHSLEIGISLIPSRAHGGAKTKSTEIIEVDASIVEIGKAKGFDGIKHDNEFLMLAA
jgi:hypothetical protein